MNTAWAAPAELDIYAAAESGAAIAALLADLEAGGELCIDLAQVRELDAAGLQLLLSTALSGRREQRRITFVGIPEVVRERFGQFGLGAYLAEHRNTGERA